MCGDDDDDDGDSICDHGTWPGRCRCVLLAFGVLAFIALVMGVLVVALWLTVNEAIRGNNSRSKVVLNGVVIRGDTVCARLPD